MGGKHRNKKRSIIFLKLLKIVLVLLLAVGGVKLGLAGGSMISQLDAGIVKHIDVQTFKMTLNNSLPLIDTIYNSGNISVSFSGEIRNIIKGIFDFDLSTPVTILNAQSTVLYNYYNKDYKSYVARRDQYEKIDYSELNDDISRGEAEERKENASSIRSDDSDEKPEIVETPAEVEKDSTVLIDNETRFKVSVDDIMKGTLKTKLDTKKTAPQVLIYHTHTTESYLKDLSELNKGGIPKWNEDPRYNVVRVGEELAQNLKKKYNIEVIHNGKINDADYNSSYATSLNTVEKILKSYPTIKFVFDIHRDGLGGTKKLRTATKIENKGTARPMFVIGSNHTGLSHPNWRENLKLGVKLQQKLNEQYPGFAKPIILSMNRYNQHVTNGAIIIEIGGDGDTLDEALECTKYLAKAINDVIK